MQIITLWLSVFDSAAWVQPSDQKPDKAFWPREVRISEEVKVEQKTKYGVTDNEEHDHADESGDLEADRWFCRKGGQPKRRFFDDRERWLFGKISVEKTNFWDRAEKTTDAANQKDYREKALVRERERKEAEERVRVGELRGMRPLPLFRSR